MLFVVKARSGSANHESNTTWRKALSVCCAVVSLAAFELRKGPNIE